jgi:outer membrane protein OmpA-like peptidoglycan-associated protein
MHKSYLNIIFSIILIFVNSFVFSQNIDDELDALINEGNYDEAIQLADALLGHQPDDASLNFKMGYCYLNTILRKDKSILYLKKAVEIYEKTDANSNAATEAKFHLGKAYHVNYQFKNAIDNFSSLKKQSKNNEVIKAIEKEINQCKTGLELTKKPIETQITNLGEIINSKYSDHSAVVSADESVIIFTSRRQRFNDEKVELDGQYNEDIYISYFENQRWTKPVSISENINTEAHEASIGITPDGQQIFIYRDIEGGTILTSYLIGDKWSAPVSLGSHINTRYRETHASISANNKYLYFTSDRPGGYGGLDVYVSEKQANGEWGKAVNMGDAINTAEDEEGPFIHHDGISLYFNSKGHNTMGGYDVFLSQKNEFGTWTKAENIGYPLNTTNDDAFFMLTTDGKRAYYSSFKSEGFGNSDIYLMGLPEAEEKSLAIVKGIIKACDEDISNVVITVFTSENDEIVGLYRPNSKTGKYLFILNKGKDYVASYQIGDNEEHTETFHISKNSDFQIIYKTISLIGNKNCDNVVGKIKDIADKTNTVQYENTEEYDKNAVYVEDILFKVNSFQLDYFKNNLKKLTNYLKSNTDTKIELIGYSDTQGPESYNIKLSEKRAKIVADYLLKLGVDKKQISYKVGGVSNQISINKYQNGAYVWQSLPYNRRVEFKIITNPTKKLKFRKIKIPVLYDINPDPEKIKKELARLDSIYTIQIGAYRNPISQKYLKEIKNLQMFFTGNLYKYSTGEYKNEKKARKELVKIKELGFSDAYIRKVIEYFPEKLKQLK